MPVLVSGDECRQRVQPAFLSKLEAKRFIDPCAYAFVISAGHRIFRRSDESTDADNRSFLTRTRFHNATSLPHESCRSPLESDYSSLSAIEIGRRAARMA